MHLNTDPHYRATGVVRNFNWEGPNMEKFCDISLVTFFDDVITTTSLKRRYNFFKVLFRHN